MTRWLDGPAVVPTLSAALPLRGWQSYREGAHDGGAVASALVRTAVRTGSRAQAAPTGRSERRPRFASLRRRDF